MMTILPIRSEDSTVLDMSGLGLRKEKLRRPAFRIPNIKGTYHPVLIIGFLSVVQLDRLVTMRMKTAKLYAEAVDGCNWLTPQLTPEGYIHSYWTYVLKLETDMVDFSWYDFRRKYMELGGDGIYAAWKVNYLEPVFQKYAFYHKGCPIKCPFFEGQAQQYKESLYPITETIQPRLLQFKTNYSDIKRASKQAEILSETIEYFGV